MSRVFLPLLLLAVAGGLAVVVYRWWRWASGAVLQRRRREIDRQLVQAITDLELEQARSRRLDMERDRIMRDIEAALLWDAEGVPFLSASVREKAEGLVNKYNEEKGRK